jgi:hypothetical protein
MYESLTDGLKISDSESAWQTFNDDDVPAGAD